MSGQSTTGPGGRMLESLRLANQTRWAAGRSTKLLSVNSVVPDARIDAAGRLVKTLAYDLGSAPPPLPVDADGLLVQELDVASTLESVLDRLAGPFRIKPVRPAIRRVLDWLEQFPGATW